MVTLDIKNGINMSCNGIIISELRKRWVARYLVKMESNYLRYRKVQFMTSGRLKELKP